MVPTNFFYDHVDGLYPRWTLKLAAGREPWELNGVEEALRKSRKAHLLEDKQIPSVGVFDEVLALGWHLEEIHVTLAHLEKKQTRLRTCTKIHQEVLFSERGDGVAGIKPRRHNLFGDGV
ncbi:hypothetical protein Tco_0083977 [Tanacetum coccineum]